MMTALPPAATTSAAVWRPIPLLPPTTTSFCPAKTGIAIGRSAPSVSICGRGPSSQFMLIRTFLSGGSCLLTDQPRRRGSAAHRQIGYR